LDEKITELTEKMEMFTKNGDADHDKEKEALTKNIESEAKKELAAEREEERKNREDPYGYGA